MGVRIFQQNKFNKFNSFQNIQIELLREKKFIEENFNFLNCSITDKKLLCKGIYKPTEYSKEYSFKIVYDGIVSPSVFVIDPVIKYNDDIHMFPQNNSLCLYHREVDNFYWTPRKQHIFDTIVPWTLEWFIYYELYMISGKWQHPFIQHNKEKSKR